MKNITLTGNKAITYIEHSETKQLFSKIQINFMKVVEKRLVVDATSYFHA